MVRSAGLWSHLAVAIAAAAIVGWLSQGGGPQEAAAHDKGSHDLHDEHDHTHHDHKRSDQKQIDRLIGDGDIRFGVPINPGDGALVANWRNHRAYFIDDQGEPTPLDFRLKHQHTGRRVPADGMLLVQSSRGDYYVIQPTGETHLLQELPDHQDQ